MKSRREVKEIEIVKELEGKLFNIKLDELNLNVPANADNEFFKTLNTFREFSNNANRDFEFRGVVQTVDKKIRVKYKSDYNVMYVLVTIENKEIRYILSKTECKRISNFIYSHIGMMLLHNSRFGSASHSIIR